MEFLKHHSPWHASALAVEVVAPSSRDRAHTVGFGPRVLEPVVVRVDAVHALNDSAKMAIDTILLMLATIGVEPRRCHYAVRDPRREWPTMGHPPPSSFAADL